MAGYHGFSMSNNALDAYENGEAPKSKWTKSAIISALEAEGIEAEKLVLVKKLSVAFLKDKVLYRSSWHHTSSHFNRTDFYSVDADAIFSASTEDIQRWISEDKASRAEARSEAKQKAEEPPKPQRVKAHFLEWGGTRKHPKAKDIIEDGILTDDEKWFIREDGSRKSTSARGFYIIEEYED